MADNELIYVVKFETDQASLKQVQQQAAQAQQSVKASVSGGSRAGSGSAVKEIKELTVEEAKLRIAKTETTKATLDQARAQLALQKEVKTTGSTYRELAKANGDLLARLKELDFQKDAAEIKTLSEAYKANNDKLKEFDKTLGNNQRNVGNYKDSIIDALGGLNAFGQPVALATKGILEQGSAFINTAKGAEGLKGAFAGLNSVLKANVIFAAVSAVVALGNALQTVEPIADAFKNIFAGIDGVVKGVIKTITSGGGLFANISKSVEAAQALNKSQEETFTKETELIKLRSTNQAIIAENKEAAKDENRTIVERIQLLSSAIILQNKIAAAEEKVLERKVDEAKVDADLQKNSRESLRAVAEAEATLNESRVRNANARKEIQEGENTLLRQQKAEVIELKNLEIETIEQVNQKALASIDTRRASFAQLKNIALTEFKDARANINAKAKLEEEAAKLTITNEELLAAKIKEIRARRDMALVNAAIQLEQKEQSIDQDLSDSRIATAQITADSIAGISEGLQAVGLISAKRAFQIGKAADAAQATTAGILATQRALAVLPAPNYLLAGLTAAAAAGNVAKILSTPFGGGSAGGVQAPRGAGASVAAAAPSPGITFSNVPAQVASTVSGGAAPTSQTFVVQNNIDRAGIATLVREGNDEISSRGIAVSSV